MQRLWRYSAAEVFVLKRDDSICGGQINSDEKEYKHREKHCVLTIIQPELEQLERVSIS
jgi:hypothetical protein